MSGEQTPPEQTEQVTQEQTPETVSRAEFEKVMAEMHKYKGQLREIATASHAEKEKLLREQNNFQELAVMKEREASEYKEKLELLQTSLVDREKYSALKDAAMKAGLRAEALTDLELVALDKVQVETTSTGRVNVLGVSQAIESLKVSRPHWFGGSKTTVAGALPTATSGAGGLVTLEEIIKLSNEASKSGDYATYEAKMKQYQQQRKA